MSFETTSEAASIGVDSMPPESRTATDLARGAVRWIHAWFIVILLSIDALAAFWPLHWESLRGDIGVVPVVALPIRLPSLLLAGMLMIAGMSLRPEHFRHVVHRPGILLCGTIGCWLVPALLLLTFAYPLSRLLPDDYRDEIWLGLVLVAAMPAAQSSAAWTQNARGNVLLCLALVLATTILSPLIVPGFIELLAGEETPDLPIKWQQILAWVVAPSFFGWTIAAAIGHARVDRWRPWLSLCSALMLLILNYINAVEALPKLVERGLPWAIPLATLGLSAILCGGAYLTAIFGARAIRLPPAEQTAFAYALGMKNNGVALMLTAGTHELVGLVLISYIVIQHLGAGIISQVRRRRIDSERLLRQTV